MCKAGKACMALTPDLQLPHTQLCSIQLIRPPLQRRLSGIGL